MLKGLKPKTEFTKWAKSLSGCDGGNLKSEYYFCGIEWGTGGEENLVPKLFDNDPVGKAGNLAIPGWTNQEDQAGFFINEKRKTVRFDQKIAKLYLDNKIYLLRSLRCRSSSRARPYAPEDRGQSTSGTLVLCFAARRSGHIW
jgi:hypothetical protein